MTKGKLGKKNLNQYNPFFEIAKIVILVITPQPRANVWKIWLVTVKLKGIIPRKFETKINKKRTIKKNKMTLPFPTIMWESCLRNKII